MSLKDKIIEKLKNELASQDINNIIINPLYDNVINKFSPYYMCLLVLLALIIILLIIAIITNIIVINKIKNFP